MRLTWLLSFALLLNSRPGLSQVIDLNGYWKFHIGDHSTWGATNFDDSKWKQIKAPAYWEDQGFNGYDGFAWYRKKFDGRKLNKNKTYYLGLGYIDDTDEVYLNGKLIGFAGKLRPFQRTAFDVDRKYVIPQDAINYTGDNIIAIRVNDFTLGGGMYDGDLGVYESEHNKFLLFDLQGVWSIAQERNQKEWDKIMTPSFWPRSNDERTAWYKRSFMMKADIPNDQLVLLAGRIDDFDEVYLNGVLIGKTNDHLPLGPSKSYMKQRAYPIPASLLKKNGENIIEIRVDDIGDNGGIYSGIVGIATRANVERYLDE